jgi:hypothetical protein
MAASDIVLTASRADGVKTAVDIVDGVLRVDASGVEGDASAAAGTVEATVTAVESGNGAVHKTVLTLADTPVTVGNTADISTGSALLYTFPAGIIQVLGAVSSGVTPDYTDAGNVTPIADGMGGDYAFGTTGAAENDQDMTGTDVDLIPSTSQDPIQTAVGGHLLAVPALFDGHTTPAAVFLSFLIDNADVADTASDVVLFSGTLTLVWANVGDY